MSGPIDPDRLYNLLPQYIRARDNAQGEPLRGLLAVISEQVEVVEADIRQLYENWFIETCDDWVVPYIADLVGYQLAHQAGEPGGVSTAEGRLLNRALSPGARWPTRSATAAARGRSRCSTLWRARPPVGRAAPSSSAGWWP